MIATLETTRTESLSKLVVVWSFSYLSTVKNKTAPTKPTAESRVHSRAPHLCGVVSARRFRGCALDDADKILRALEHADAARSALGIRTRPQNRQATLKSAIEPISSHRPRRLTGRNLVPQNWDRSSSHSLFSPSQRLRQDY